MISAAERFWSKVEKTDDCWNWRGSVTTNGYGQFWLEGRMQPAHRVALALSFVTPPIGMEVDHLCHKRRCVNPDHLRVTTHAENGQNLSGAYRTSSTGIRGVTWRPSAGKYVARIQVHGHLKHIGYFANLESAEAAAIAARKAAFQVPGRSRRKAAVLTQ